MDKNPVPTGDETIHDLLEEFRSGAKLKHFGDFLENEEVTLAGFAQFKNALRKLEAKSPAGRDVLIPLLNDPDSSVRAIACAHLITRHTDLVMPILDELIQEWGTEAASSARNTKMLFDSGLYDGR